MNNGSLVLSGCCPVPRAQTSQQEKKFFFEHFHIYIFFKEKLNILKEKKKDTIPYLTTYHESENTQIKEYDRLNTAFEGILPLLKEKGFMTQKTAIDTGIYMTKLILDRLNILAKKQNFTFAVVNIPINTQVDPLARKDYFAQFNDVTEDDFEYDKLNKIMQKFMDTKKDIIYLDLLPLFLKEGNISGKVKNIFYPCTRDMHWNALGSKRAAEETVKLLKEKKVI